MLQLFYLILVVGLLALGYFAGTIAESRHYRSIRQREQAQLNLPAVPLKQVDQEGASVAKSELVYGSVVIAQDYFKQMLAGLRNLFGGRVTAYESLLDRARREALLRMKENAMGANIVLNVRIETSSIGQGSIEAIAYGTAVTYQPST